MGIIEEEYLYAERNNNGHFPNVRELIQTGNELVLVFNYHRTVTLQALARYLNARQTELETEMRLALVFKIVVGTEEVFEKAKNERVDRLPTLSFLPSTIAISDSANILFLLFSLSKPPVLHDAITSVACNDYVGYASPEQVVAGAPPDYRSALFGLGALIFFLLTGKPLFHNLHPRHRSAIRRRKARNLHPFVSDVRPALSALDPLVNRLLSTSRELRLEALQQIAPTINNMLGLENRAQIDEILAKCVQNLLEENIEMETTEPSILETDLITNIYV